MRVLTVHHGFTLARPDAEPAAYARGDMIREPEVMEAVSAAGHADKCTATDVPADFFGPAPAKRAKR